MDNHTNAKKHYKGLHPPPSLKADTTSSTNRTPTLIYKNAHTTTQWCKLCTPYPLLHTHFNPTAQSFKLPSFLCKAACETELLCHSHTPRQHNGFCLEKGAAVTSPASLTGCIKNTATTACSVCFTLHPTTDTSSFCWLVLQLRLNHHLWSVLCLCKTQALSGTTAPCRTPKRSLRSRILLNINTEYCTLWPVRLIEGKLLRRGKVRTKHGHRLLYILSASDIFSAWVSLHVARHWLNAGPQLKPSIYRMHSDHSAGIADLVLLFTISLWVWDSFKQHSVLTVSHF